MSTELNEDQVRDLLQHAARTIDVAPSGPVADTGRPSRRWVPAALVAAALVVAAVVTGAVVAGGGRDVEPARTGDLPPVVGLFTDDAVTRLQAAGYRVQVEADDSCLPDGAALGVDLEEDRHVTLRVSGLTDSTRVCPIGERVTSTAWRFLGALDDGPTVPVAAYLNLEVDGVRTTVLSAAQAVDPDSWAAAAEPVRAALADRDVDVRSSSSPTCRNAVQPITGDGFVLTRPDDPCGTRVDLVLDGSGAVTGIDVVTTASGDPTVAPDLLGLSEAEAREALTGLVDPDAIFVVRLETGCAQTLEVSQQDPRPGVRLRPQDSVLLSIDTDTAGCGQPVRTGPDEQAVGEALVDFAAGGPPPAFADRVRLFIGRSPARSLTRSEAEELGSWQGCPEVAPGYTCPVSILSSLSPRGPNPYDVAVRAEPVLNPCGGWLAAERLPSRITANDSFFLSPPAEEITCATGFRLQVFLDDQRRITAVDLARTEP